MLRVVTSESIKPRPCFQAFIHRFQSLLSLVCLLPFLLQNYKMTFYHPYHLHFTISSPKQCSYTISHCIRCVGDTKDFLYLNYMIAREGIHSTSTSRGFDKPWVTHLREICRCPTNLCAWRPNKSTRIEVCSRHQANFWRRCREGKWHSHPPATKLFSSAVAEEVSA